MAIRAWVGAPAGEDVGDVGHQQEERADEAPADPREAPATAQSADRRPDHELERVAGVAERAARRRRPRRQREPARPECEARRGPGGGAGRLSPAWCTSALALVPRRGGAGRLWTRSRLAGRVRRLPASPTRRSPTGVATRIGPRAASRAPGRDLLIAGPQLGFQARLEEDQREPQRRAHEQGEDHDLSGARPGAVRGRLRVELGEHVRGVARCHVVRRRARVAGGEAVDASPGRVRRRASTRSRCCPAARSSRPCRGIEPDVGLGGGPAAASPGSRGPRRRSAPACRPT